MNLSRSSYGEIIRTEFSGAILAAAHALAIEAAAKRRIPAAYDEMAWERVNARVGNKRIGVAVHHEIYDVSPSLRSALVCVREVEGTKYGVKTVAKTYYIVSRHGRGIRVTEANKARAAKAAKQSAELGQALANLKSHA